MSKITKRSITIAGHATSITLEDEFWAELQKIASEKKIPLASLVHQIDKDRTEKNLSSALRIYILNHLKSSLAK
jgi:predicted DNA-binding ribbon-helix-helix protein